VPQIEWLQWLLWRLDARSLIDIAVITLIIFWVLNSIRGTRAVQLLLGVIVLILAMAISNFLRLTALNWLFRTSIPALLIAFPVIFQPELRRALERLGRTGGILNRPFRALAVEQMTRVIDEVTRAARSLADRRQGAIIILEQGTGLQDYADTGVPVDAIVSSQLLTTLFYTNTALHDGAVIVRNDRVIAAACVLPLTESNLPDPHLGTRHRAAIGITEQTDAIAVVVSEETGTISVAYNGRLIRRLDEVRLKNTLLDLCHIRNDTGHRQRRSQEVA